LHFPVHDLTQTSALKRAQKAHDLAWVTAETRELKAAPGAQMLQTEAERARDLAEAATLNAQAQLLRVQKLQQQAAEEFRKRDARTQPELRDEHIVLRL
jgi:hypothetical protein